MTKAKRLDTTQGIDTALGELLAGFLGDGPFDTVLAPIRARIGASYAAVTDPERLREATTIPATMPVHGAKAVQSLTHRGAGKRTVVAMRICEIRAAVELSKLKQAALEDLVFLSFDCPGVTPLPQALDAKSAAQAEAPPDKRPLCQICEHFAPMEDERARNVDLHIGTLGIEKDGAILVAVTPAGEEILASLELDDATAEDIEAWRSAVGTLRNDRLEKRERVFSDLLEYARGIDGLATVFERCIECRNCQSVCPICYCRLCFADRGTINDTPADMLQQADAAGAVRPAQDPLLFHLGRIAHMSLSCVSCGMCEDACPVDIPVGRVVSSVSEETRRLFDYVAGRSPDEALPLVRFEQQELTELEDA